MGDEPTAREAALLEIWQCRLAGLCGEMGETLSRAAYSPNIKEREDFSCAVFDRRGELVAQAEHIPVHLGSMHASVRAAIEAVAARGGLGPGDQVLANDPFDGGTHLNDVTFVSAAYDGDGRHLGYVANRAHHADVGGAQPGSLTLDAVDATAEGLRIPPLVAVRGGEWNADIRTLILANTRTPSERAGDLDAQRGANEVGVRRLRDLAGRHGVDALVGAMAAVNDYGERRMRAALTFGAGSVDGDTGSDRPRSAVFRDFLEDAEGREVAISVDVRITGGTLTADFTGTEPARAGCPATVEPVTRACLEYAVRAMTDPTIPRNGGASRCLRLVAPRGSVVSALPPVPVGAGNVETSQRVVDVLLGALASLFPSLACGASQGTMNNLLVGSRTGAPFVYYETVGGGQGGRPGMHGQSGIHTHMTNTANTPVEALEAEFPLRVRSYALRRGSGGDGRWRGGDGIVREIEALADCTVSVIASRRTSRPWGFDGGEPGAAGEDWLLPAGDESRAQRLPGMCTVRLAAGDVLRMLTPGGGGWGRD